MEWTQFIIMFVTILGLFFWQRTESRNDNRELRNSMETQLSAIHQEMKDFHGRLERQDAEFKAHLMYVHADGKISEK